MAIRAQTPPPLASEYSKAQRRRIDEAVKEVLARWQRMGPRFDASWTLIAAPVAAVLRDAQYDLVDRATQYTPAVMEQTGQTRVLAQVATPNAESLIGLAGNGLSLEDTLSWAPVEAKRAVGSGATATAALATASKWLDRTTTTVLADTARSAEALEMYTRNVGGYVRMVNGGACGRCVILAGKFFRKNEGFLRHPRCRCVHIPASESLAGDWQTDPRAYFDSLNDEQRIKLMGSKANAQAVADGADMGQLVNAYRLGSSSYAQSPMVRLGSLRYTTAGTTNRSRFAQQQIGLGIREPNIFATGRRIRLMPETIYATSRNRAEALRLLEQNGWISNPTAQAAGRAALAEQRRIERNRRARERRRQSRLERNEQQAQDLRGFLDAVIREQRRP